MEPGTSTEHHWLCNSNIFLIFNEQISEWIFNNKGDDQTTGKSWGSQKGKILKNKLGICQESEFLRRHIGQNLWQRDRS